MPSYHYPNPAPQFRLPPTPPEDCFSGYTSINTGAMNYQQNAFQPHMQGHGADDGYNDYYHQTQPLQSVAAGAIYQQPAYYSTRATPGPPNVATNFAYYRPMTSLVLPPLRNFETLHPTISDQTHTTRDPQDHRSIEQKEDKPVGGVSAKLDYDMAEMTDFVSETSQAIVAPNRLIPPGFRKWVHQVLSATRLPASTILLAFDFLAEHMRNIYTSLPVETSQYELHRLLITALILGSKFLDDNTFINKSWAEVSGIDIATLNYMERSWLAEISFRLHRHPESAHGFRSFYARWKDYEAKARSARNESINGSTMVVPIVQHMYTPPVIHGYGQLSPRDSYQVKFGHMDHTRSAGTSSPSLPDTGPTTPEYYGHGAHWGSLHNLYQRHPAPMLTSSQPTAPITQPAMSMASPFVSIGYVPSAPIYASGHGVDCMCVSCTRRFMMAPHFGLPQPVAG